MLRDFPVRHPGSKQVQYLYFAFAEWLDQALTGGRAVLGLVNGGQELADIPRGDPLFRGRPEQGRCSMSELPKGRFGLVKLIPAYIARRQRVGCAAG